MNKYYYIQETYYMNENDQQDDELNEDPVYIIDDDTTALVEVALNALMTLSDAQVDDMSAEALAAIADSLADRFGINRFEVIETRHTDDNGKEEIIYSPKGGIMPDVSNDNEEEE